MQLEVAVRLRAAAQRQPSAGKAHTVFRVEIVCNGRRHCVEKRYSEFYALHKRKGDVEGTQEKVQRNLALQIALQFCKKTRVFLALNPEYISWQIKRTCQVPGFPPKRVPNWMAKVLHQRRAGLEAYLQGVILQNQELPSELLNFLKLWPGQQEPDLAWDEDSSLQDSSSSSAPLLHRPVLSFHSDPYVLPSSTDFLPNVILSGVLQGLYTREHHLPGIRALHGLGFANGQ